MKTFDPQDQNPCTFLLSEVDNPNAMSHNELLGEQYVKILSAIDDIYCDNDAEHADCFVIFTREKMKDGDYRCNLLTSSLRDPTQHPYNNSLLKFNDKLTQTYQLDEEITIAIIKNNLQEEIK